LQNRKTASWISRLGIYFAMYFANKNNFSDCFARDTSVTKHLVRKIGKVSQHCSSAPLPKDYLTKKSIHFSPKCVPY
jgi:hypothetical protein